MNGIVLEQVGKLEYLGFILRNDLSKCDDTCRVRNKFYSDFNCLLQKFHFADSVIKIFLFKEFCLQFYGSELWCGNDRAQTTLQ